MGVSLRLIAEIDLIVFWWCLATVDGEFETEAGTSYLFILVHGLALRDIAMQELVNHDEHDKAMMLPQAMDPAY